MRRPDAMRDVGRASLAQDTPRTLKAALLRLEETFR